MKRLCLECCVGAARTAQPQPTLLASYPFPPAWSSPSQEPMNLGAIKQSHFHCALLLKGMGKFFPSPSWEWV